VQIEKVCLQKSQENRNWKEKNGMHRTSQVAFNTDDENHYSKAYQLKLDMNNFPSFLSKIVDLLSLHILA
jgi:hypothetical protein